MTSPDPFRLDGRVAVVTGAGRGIGAAIAVELASAGADVALLARTESDLRAVAARVEALGRRALVHLGDANDLDALAEVVERTVGELGGLDVVVSNAGGSVSRPFLETRVEQLERSFHFNVSVPFELVRRAVPHLLARGGGSVLVVSSVAGSRVTRGGLVHGTTKAALSQMTRLMAADLAPRIRVNAILPGAVETEALARYLDEMDPDARSVMAARTAMRRNGTPDDVAHAARYLCSPAASWVTGELLVVDGLGADDLVPKSIPDLEGPDRSGPPG